MRGLSDVFPAGAGDSVRQRLESLFLDRVQRVDPAEGSLLAERLRRRLREWEAWNPAEYGSFGPPPDNPPLMHPAGSHARDEWNDHSWPTMGSLRNVDATCEGEITTFYNELEGEEVES